jgi:prepilin-type N-terminal cleavage/methylation domain-containing protein
MKLLGNGKGTSLVEVIVAMTVLGILSMVTATVFVNSMSTSNSSREQIEINAVLSTVAENITAAVKRPDADIMGNAGTPLRTAGGTGYDLPSGYDDLVVMDGSGDINPHYKFDVSRDAGGPSSISGNALLKYAVRLKKADGTPIRTFKLEINTLDFKNTLP